MDINGKAGCMRGRRAAGVAFTVSNAHKVFQWREAACAIFLGTVIFLLIPARLAGL
jgi:hypothetical protein